VHKQNQRNLFSLEPVFQLVTRKSLEEPLHTQFIQRSILLASLIATPLAGPALLAQAAAAPAPAAPAPAAPLSMPSMSGPLSTASPETIDAGPFGKVQVTGILSGFAYVQSNKTSDHTKNADISNAQAFVQKTTGLWQFYLQGGAYNLPALGSPFFTTRDTVSDFYGPFPQGYLKLAPKGSFSYEIGKLPTLIGAEYTFTFENFNVERGLLWNQENAVNRGLQVNYAKNKWSSSLAWSDGFYSNKYDWLSGMLTYTQNAANAYEFVAMGNYGTNTRSAIATPTAQNNSSIYNLIYTHTGKKYILQPYVQFTYVPQSATIGVGKSTYTFGGAVLGTYTVSPVFTLAARAEYIGSSGNATDGSANLMYGPGSKAFSLTVTPTYIKSAFFARADFSVVGVTSSTAGDVFGSTGTDTNQVRGVVEAGFMF
jgi:hypothetical protein